MTRHRLSGLLAVPLVLGALLQRAHALHAQPGDLDVVTGTVLDAAAQPVEGASVVATSITTGLTRSTTTNQAGRYALVFSEHGGWYRLLVRSVGSAPGMFTIRRDADSQLVGNVQLLPPGTPAARFVDRMVP